MRFAALVTIFFACSPSSPGTTTDASGQTADGHGGSGSGSGSSGGCTLAQDPPPGPYGCLGVPVPTTAPDPVIFGGSAVTISGTSEVPASGVSINVEDANGNSLGTATSDANGAYSMSLPTGCNALDIHVAVTKSGDRDSALYPATSLYTSTTSGFVVIVTQNDFDLLAELSNVTQSTSKGAVGVVVLDCEGNALSGATVTIPGGDVVYLSGGIPSTSASSTDSTGIALVFNVPAGSAMLSASVGGMTLRSHTVNAAAGVTTIAAIRP